MRIAGQQLQTISFDEERKEVKIIDQTRLPHVLDIVTLSSLSDAEHAIRCMQVRGAPLIGVTAAYGIYLAMKEDPAALDVAIERLLATRPTAVNLQWALRSCEQILQHTAQEKREVVALLLARDMEKEDIAICARIGEHGADLLQAIWDKECKASNRALNVLTHCNAGALATVDWGTALACIYKASERGIPLHVWVDETRPRNQGAALTCWELGQQEIEHTLIVDNAGGHLMQQGQVDVCVVGSDRTTSNGDVCNKIGTYLKALSANDNDIPFYVALPVSTIDFDLASGAEIPIEERAADEVTQLCGVDDEGLEQQVRIAPKTVRAGNPGFDVTPARLVSALITEHGVFEANEESLHELRSSLS